MEHGVSNFSMENYEKYYDRNTVAMDSEERRIPHQERRATTDMVATRSFGLY